MALQMNMKMEGISGDSKSFSHKGWTEVISWTWGMTSNRKLVQEEDADKTNMNEIAIVKSLGADSPDIRLFFAQGKVIPSVEFNVIPKLSAREVPTKYLHIKLEDVVIKSIITGGNNEDNFFKEHITLLFDKIKFEFSKATPIAKDGTHAEAENFYFAWNVPGNKEWQH